jgi:outer membrane protein assembly complex protein YaeT
VHYEFEQPEEGLPRARFTIREGPLVTIGAVHLEGTRHLEKKEREELQGEVRAGEPFVQSRLGKLVGALRGHYLRSGFLEVAVDEPEVARAGDSVRITIEVREGSRHVLRAARIIGAVPDLERAMADVASAAVGRPFVPHLAYELRAGILREHASAGYPDCAVEVDTETDPVSGDVSLTLRAKPGPLVEIAAVKVQGNEAVPGDRMLARVLLEPGDRYDAKRLNRSFNLLYATGLFEVVRFDLQGEGEQRTLLIDVAEAPSQQVFLEPGWGSYEGPRVRLGVEETNLLSSGRRAKIEGWYSELAKGVEATLGDPFLWGAPLNGELSLLAHDREEPSFTVDEVGGGLDFRRPWTEDFSTTVGLAYRETQLSDVKVSNTVPQEFLDSVDIGELNFSLSYDTRDNVLITTRGGLARFHSSVALEALGSSLEAFETGIDLSATLPVGERTQVAAAMRTALIAPYGDSDQIPLQFRMFNGGENTVRSFRESELGPLDSTGEPIGGETRTGLSVELRRRVAGNLSGALFYDTGNVELNFEDYLDFADFRHGIGVGIRYLLPIGPLRLDAAWNPDARDGEDEWVIHFAVGLPY